MNRPHESGQPVANDTNIVSEEGTARIKLMSPALLSYYKHKDDQGFAERRKASRDKFRTKLRETVIKHYSNGTMRCTNPKCKVPSGMDDLRALSIDHINGGGNKHRKAIVGGRGGIGFYIWLYKNNFPEGFTCLCMNCQFIKRHENGKTEMEYNDQVN